MSLGEGSKVGLCVLCLLGCLLDECGICGLSSSEPRRSRLGYHGISMVGGGFCYHGCCKLPGKNSTLWHKRLGAGSLMVELDGVEDFEL
jgi:hypothetical protein